MSYETFHSFTNTRWAVPNRIWEKIARELDDSKNMGRPRSDDRVILNAIVWKFASCAPWRDMPARFPPYTTVNTRYLEWQKSGIWQKISEIMRKENFPPFLKVKTIRIKAIKDLHWNILKEMLGNVYEKIEYSIPWSPEKPEEYYYYYKKKPVKRKLSRIKNACKKETTERKKRKYFKHQHPKYPHIELRNFSFLKFKPQKEVSELTRKHVDGIIWKMETYANWRDIPPRYGKWLSIYFRQARWISCGAWPDIFEFLKENGYLSRAKKEEIFFEKLQEIHDRQKSKGIIK